jgi:sugar lactone lactonase YvrE
MDNVKTWWVWGVCAAGVVLLVSCPPSSVKRCTTADDCEASLVCVTGYCAKPEPGADGGSGATGKLVLLAGSLAGAGNVDGVGAGARFDFPIGLARDQGGNVYVADTGNCVIRKVTKEGTVKTVAGQAGECRVVDGKKAVARIQSVTALAVASDGSVFFTERRRHVIRKANVDGEINTISGLLDVPGSADGRGLAARFNEPYGVAVDGIGNVYIVDSKNFTVRKISVDGQVTTLAGAAGGSAVVDGTGRVARFRSIRNIAVDSTGILYLVDSGLLRLVSPQGVVSTKPVETETGDGGVVSASVGLADGLCLDSSGALYVASAEAVSRVTPDGKLSLLVGTSGQPRPVDGIDTRIVQVGGVACEIDGSLIVSDSLTNTLRRASLVTGEITTFAGAFAQGFADGAGAMARFAGPTGVATDLAGDLLVGDYGNSRIRSVSPTTGVVTTRAGGIDEGEFFDADAGINARSVGSPADLVVLPSGDLVVADGRFATIRRVDSTGAVSLIAGKKAEYGSRDGTGEAALFNSPQAVAATQVGDFVVIDVARTSALRKVTASGVVTTLSATSVGSGNADGPLGSVKFTAPADVVIDGRGVTYVADALDHTIRAISPTGMVTTLAGVSGQGAFVDGVGSVARFNGPTGLALAADGTLFVADYSNHAIRKITPAGEVTTVVGTPGVGSASPGPLPAKIGAPVGVAVLPNGQLAITAGGGVYVTEGAKF